ncbi:UNVERIFIED_ORG: hypothetical protein ABID57_001273 [Arthrobacter sp. UYEF1]
MSETTPGRVTAVNANQTLRELVETAVERHQTSVRQLSMRAQERGFKVVDTTLNQIRNGTYKSVPSDVTIRAIAWLAGVSDEVAFTAAGQPVPGPPFAEELPPGVDNLSLKSRKAALDMLRVLVDLEKDADHAGNTQHQDQPADATGTGSDARDARAGQKTPQPIFLNSGVARSSETHDGNIPLPEDYLDLAAHPATDSSGRREHDAGRERGEESQDSDN